MNRTEKEINGIGETETADPVDEGGTVPTGTDGTAVSPPDEVTPATGTETVPDGEPSVEELHERVRSVEDRLMRQAAEFQNYRRRTEQEKARMVSFGKALVVQQLLDVVDDFERSLESARSVGSEGKPADARKAFAALRDGVELVYAKLRDELSKVGVEEIDAVGRPFDEEEHEALMRQPAAEGQEAGVVVGQIQKGYRMDDRVLRHAKVIVSA